MNTLYGIQTSTACVCTLLLLVVLSSCTSRGHCIVGAEVTIPNNDNSAPVIVGIDFHMPDGSLVTRNPGDGLSNQIVVPTNGDVTVIAAVKDDQGVKDVQLFAAASVCTKSDPSSDVASCEGPGLQGAPATKNPETHAAGEVGCNQRLVTYKVNISKTPTFWNDVTISVKGINFGGQVVTFGSYTLTR